jgi:hypothetical protein
MNRAELKKTLKPLIKECIREVLLEESGVLSRVVSEVVGGITSPQQRVVTESRTVDADEEITRREQEKMRALQEHKRKMLDAIGNSSYNGVDLFEGTTPMSTKGSSTPSGAAAGGPMRDLDPNDPGVDINSIPGLNLDVARKLMG